MEPKKTAKVVAFAYDNPVFEQETAPAKVRDSLAVVVNPGEDDEVAEMFYPEPEKLFLKLKWEYWAEQLLILGHILLVAYTEPLDSNSLLLQILLAALQMSMLGAIVIGFFVLTSQTIFVQLGQYDKYLSEFKFFLLTFLVEFCLMVAAKVYALVLLGQWTSHLQLWRVPGFLPLWIVQRAVLLIFWVAAAHNSLQVFNPQYYDPDYLMKG